MPPLPRSFYIRDAITVARDLLGVHLVRRTKDGLLTGKIVETEAYLGAEDPASHAYRGRTARNDVMFRAGGHLYVYFTYGMHFCSNIVTGPEGTAGAVLLRAVEPVEGCDLMLRNRTLKYRGRKTPASVGAHLTDGPARLCEAFAINREDNGTDLTRDVIYCVMGEPVPDSEVGATPRIGISVNKGKRWRFVVKESGFVSGS
jgi:DNA-3-methyladenine glycosylase